VFDADDPIWYAITTTFQVAVIYYDTGNYATSPLLGYVNFGEDVTLDDQVLHLKWPDDGIMIIASTQ
jgi:hypothetical protein